MTNKPSQSEHSAETDQPDTHRFSAEVAGKYMTFKLADEEYGVEILKVRDINRIMKITRVPRTRPFVRGVINLRGKVIPVIDLRMKFGMGRIEETAWTVIIVVQYTFLEQELTMGILVDEVLEVLDISDRQIEPPPNFGTGVIDTDFILGVGKVGSRVIFLLDIGKVLTAEESETLALETPASHPGPAEESVPVGDASESSG